jgi:Mrp family chromosome partitioning ATPase
VPKHICVEDHTLRPSCAERRLHDTRDRVLEISRFRHPSTHERADPLRRVLAHQLMMSSLALRTRRRGGAGVWLDNLPLPAQLLPIAVHRRLVVAAVAVSLLGGVAWLYLIPPKYSAKATFLASPLPIRDPAFIGLPILRVSGDLSHTMQTAAGLLNSPSAADHAATSLGRGWTGEKVTAAVTISPEPGSNLVDVTAVAQSPQLAARVANAYARAITVDRKSAAQLAARSALSAEAGSRVQSGAIATTTKAVAHRLDALQAVRANGDPTLVLIRPALPPRAPTRGNAALILLVALIAGAAIGSGAAYLSEQISWSAVAKEDEIIARTRLPVLGRMPAFRTRRNLPRAWSEPSADVAHAMQMLVTQLQLRNPPPQAIMITSPSRGDGRTTTAINLAAQLARRGARTLLLDLDVRHQAADVAQSLGLETRDAARSASLSEILVEWPLLPGLRVASLASRGVGLDAETLLRSAPAVLAEARQLADYVVLDMPPWGETPDPLSMVGVVDAVLVVARPGGTPVLSVNAIPDLRVRARDTAAGLVLIGGQRRTSGRSTRSIPLREGWPKPV